MRCKNQKISWSFQQLFLRDFGFNVVVCPILNVESGYSTFKNVKN
jgi:hypothetical protein